MNTTPPRLAARLVELVSPREGRDEILGDLYERFLYVIEENGIGRARRWYWKQALRSTAGFARYGLLRSKSRGTHHRQGTSGAHRSSSWELVRSIFADMRFAFRSFRKHPGAIAVAIFSLGVGIGANVTIFSVVLVEDDEDLWDGHSLRTRYTVPAVGTPDETQLPVFLPRPLDELELFF